MVKILNLEPKNYCNEARKILRSVGRLHEKELSRPQLLQAIAQYDIILARFAHRWDQACLGHAGRLKVLATPSTGLDHIDLAYARERKIKIISLQGDKNFLKNVVSTAELTWGLLLAVIRHIPQASLDVLDRNWNRSAFLGSELLGKRLGIAGLGRVGSQVAHYGLAFGMQVAAYDPGLNRWPKKIKRCLTLKNLLHSSDIVSLHVPLNDRTRHMISKTELAQLPKGAVIINTSRGAVIDEPELLAALKDGHLGGAGLDVLEGEGEQLNSSLLHYARKSNHVVITPHIGGVTWEAWRKTEVHIAQKIQSYVACHLKN